MPKARAKTTTINLTNDEIDLLSDCLYVGMELVKSLSNIQTFLSGEDTGEALVEKMERAYEIANQKLRY